MFSINAFFNELPIRIIGTHEEPIFYAKDVAKILGIKNVRTSVQNYTNREIVTKEKREQMGLKTYKKYKNTLREDNTVILLTERGFYRMILKSNSEIALDFRDHVFDLITKARLAESERINTMKSEEINRLNNRLQETTSELNIYKKEVPAIYIFQKEINGGNPYEYMVNDEAEQYMKDRSEKKSDYITKYTLKPRPEDYKLYGEPRAKIYTVDGLDLLVCIKDDLCITEKASHYCKYSTNEKMKFSRKCETPYKLIGE